MPRRGVQKWFNWRYLLGDKAWLTSELAPKMGLSPVCTRRYLRMAYYSRALVRKRWGRYWYYALRDALEFDTVKVCLECGEILEGSRCKCGSSKFYDAVVPKEQKVQDFGRKLSSKAKLIEALRRSFEYSSGG